MRRPSLLTLFSIISLALFIVIGALLGWGLTTYFEREAIDQQKRAVESLIPPVVGDHLTPDILANGAHEDPADHNDAYSKIETALSNLGGSGLARIKVWNKEGMIVYSDEPDLVGQTFPISEELIDTFEGETVANISDLGRAENIEEVGFGELLEVYTPLRLPGQVEISGAYEGYYDITDLRDQITVTNQFFWTSIITGFLFLFVSLFTIVRDASLRIARQSSENAMLLADTARKAARLEVVNALARSINESSLDLDRVFETALSGIGRIVENTGVSITLLDERTRAARRMFTSQPGIEELSAEVKQRLLGKSDTFLCGNTRFAQAPELVELSRRGVISLLLVTICLGERNLGILRVASDMPDAFDAGDAAILKGVADQLAVAIENTRLIKETAETTALRETNRLKDEFVSMISHELRTPLASIKGYSHTMLTDTDGHWDEQTRREFLTIISEESDKLAELVENLLEMSRIERGSLPITLEPLLLWRFCKEVVNRLGTHHPDMTFVCDLDHALPVVLADPRRVEQVLVNLLQNAAKYSGAEKVEVSASYDDGTHVLIKIEDDGIGISPDHLPHLFDKFYRVGADQGDKGSGTGLGLAIVKALVEAQGGQVWVESKLGEGTTFYFTLPVLAIEEEEEQGVGNGKLEVRNEKLEVG
jgi:signal transduction histidine kinase